jgi:FMN phosphatase YigB (HAD superfamily)
MRKLDYFNFVILCLETQLPKFSKSATAMFQEFLAAIDVKKTQSLMKRGKTPEEALDIHNEIKIMGPNLQIGATGAHF